MIRAFYQRLVAAGNPKMEYGEDLPLTLDNMRAVTPDVIIRTLGIDGITFRSAANVAGPGR